MRLSGVAKQGHAVLYGKSQNKMAMNIKKLSASPESSSSLMIVAGVLSLLGSLVVAVFVWRRWNELGVQIGTNGWIAIAINSVGTVALAVASGIWALRKINSLSGSDSVKCIIGFMLDALALAVFMAFVMVAYYG